MFTTEALVSNECPLHVYNTSLLYYIHCESLGTVTVTSPPANASAPSTGVSCSATPTMKLLTKWRIISTVSAKWRPLADVLEIDHNVTAGIQERSHGDPELACREVLTKWLNGEGSTPVSWDELIDCVESVGFSMFAGELKAKLNP